MTGAGPSASEKQIARLRGMSNRTCRPPAAECRKADSGQAGQCERARLGHRRNHKRSRARMRDGIERRSVEGAVVEAGSVLQLNRENVCSRGRACREGKCPQQKAQRSGCAERGWAEAGAECRVADGWDGCRGPVGVPHLPRGRRCRHGRGRRHQSRITLRNLCQYLDHTPVSGNLGLGCRVRHEVCVVGEAAIRRNRDGVSHRHITRGVGEHVRQHLGGRRTRGRKQSG